MTTTFYLNDYCGSEFTNESGAYSTLSGSVSSWDAASRYLPFSSIVREGRVQRAQSDAAFSMIASSSSDVPKCHRFLFGAVIKLNVLLAMYWKYHGSTEKWIIIWVDTHQEIATVS
jgi:hypothetical protein